MSVVLTTQTTGNGSAIQGTPFTGFDNGQFLIYSFFNVTPSNAGNGGYITGGDPMTFLGVSDFLKSTYAPLQLTIFSQNGGGAGHSGFAYYYRPGGLGNAATIANGKFQVLQPGNANSPMVEIAQGAYPAAVLTDIIVANGCFVRI